MDAVGPVRPSDGLGSRIQREGINWVAVIAFSIVHIGAVTALFFFSWPAFFTALVVYWIALSWGVGMGYHLLFAYCSYVISQPVVYFLAVGVRLSLRSVADFGGWA